MANLTENDIADILKEIYPNGAPPEVMYKSCPLFAMMEKDEDFEGELYKLGIVYGDPQGRSANFTNAQNNQQPGKYDAYDLTIVSDYGLASVDGVAIAKARGKKGALVPVFKREMDGALRQLSRSAHHAIYRNGGGAMGRISTAAFGVVTIALTQKRDIVFFEVGQEVVVSVDDGTGGGGVRAGTATITKVNRRTGEITTDANWNAQIAAIAQNDYVFVQGDYNAKMKGLAAWLPDTDPAGGDNFYGVNRSNDRARLAGVYVDVSAQPLEEGLLDGVEEVALNGGMPDVVFMNTKQVNNLAKSLGSKVNYDRRVVEVERADGSTATFGFRTLKMDCAVGTVDVIGDINCPIDAAYALQMDTWVLVSIGKVPQVLNDDGLPYLRQNNADGVEVRNVYRANPGCRAPGWNGRFKLAA